MMFEHLPMMFEHLRIQSEHLPMMFEPLWIQFEQEIDFFTIELFSFQETVSQLYKLSSELLLYRRVRKLPDIRLQFCVIVWYAQLNQLTWVKQDILCTEIRLARTRAAEKTHRFLICPIQYHSYSQKVLPQYHFQ